MTPVSRPRALVGASRVLINTLPSEHASAAWGGDPEKPRFFRSSSKVGAADFAYLRRSWSGRWGLWATRRVVQGPVGKLLELVHRGRQSPRPSAGRLAGRRSPGSR